jgi:hypothetical protein
MLTPDARGKNRLAGLALIVAAGLLGMFFVVWPGVRGGRMPADLGDGRFNAYMLEHFHRWITGREPEGFWNAPFFYPFPWVTAFSDNFLGTGPVYSLFRWAGLDGGDAFRWWYLAGYAANYAACAWVLTKLRLRAVAVAAGAFIFTFNMAALAHGIHAQLVWRCGIPLAAWFFCRALRDGRLADWLWCGFWFVWQFYAGVYTGTFLAMLLVALGAAVAVVNVPPRMRPGGTFGKALAGIFIAPTAAAWRDADALRRGAVAAGFAVLAAAMAALLYPYLHASALYGFQRPWGVTYWMLPRVWSYLYSYNSLLWPEDLQIFSGLPYKAEHAMFTGAAVWALFAMSAVAIQRGRVGGEWRRPLLQPLLLAMLGLVALTLMAFHLTLYRLVYALPGLGAIRAVTRIIVVLLFPVAMVCAVGVDALLERARELQTARRGAAVAMRAALAVLLAGVVLEAVLIRHIATRKAGWQSQLTTMQAALDAMHLPSMPPAPPDARPVLFVPLRPGELYFYAELDGMMLAQQNGFATLNGYSGNMPPGIDLSTDGASAANRLLAYFNFLGIADESRARALAARVLVWNGRGFEHLQWTGFPKPRADPVSPDRP